MNDLILTKSLLSYIEILELNKDTRVDVNIHNIRKLKLFHNYFLLPSIKVVQNVQRRFYKMPIFKRR